MSEIVVVPNSVLRTPAKAVNQLDKKVLTVISEMFEILKASKNPQGVGLAAPQIGVSLRIFLIRPDPKKAMTLFINPEIIKSSLRQNRPHKDGVYEGCLSIPGHYAPVTRAMSVTVKYQTIDNLKFEILNLKSILNFKNSLKIKNFELKITQKVFSGFEAHVIQHEMDHLNGVLFIDRVLEQKAKLYRVSGKEWVEVGI